jgi:DNA primase
VVLIDLYKEWFRQGLEPSPKDFLYHQDPAISSAVVSLMEFPHEVSSNWKDRFEMAVPDRDAVYKDDVESSVHYLQLRKIKRLIEENQKDLEQPHTSEELDVLLKTHQLLKQQEMGMNYF